MHLRVLPNELVHFIMASRGLIEPPLQPHCTRCPRILRLQPSRTLSGPAFLHGSFCTHGSLCQEHSSAFTLRPQSPFPQSSLPHVSVNICFQRTVFVLHSTYLGKTVSHLCDHSINAYFALLDRKLHVCVHSLTYPKSLALCWHMG